jgi:hypothetical protein
MSKEFQSLVFDDPIWKKVRKHPRYALKKLRRKARHFVQDTIRFTFQSPEDWGIVNQNEIRLVGLRRSGNHALINWIGKQQDGVVEHLNNIPIGENPYRHHYEYTLDRWPEKTKMLQLFWQQSQGNFYRKNCLIYNYEDYGLAKIFYPAFERKHDWYLGKSERRFDVIIIRDPFNLLASRIKKKKSFIHVKSSNRTFTDLWKEYAKEYLGETNYLQQTKVCVNYNRWIQDVEYRRSIAEKLGLHFSDTGFQEMADMGSSFENTRYGDETAQQELMSRWQHYLDDDLFQMLLRDRELIEYSNYIFGKLPAADNLQQKALSPDS